jgi:hypothetical protein
VNKVEKEGYGGYEEHMIKEENSKRRKEPTL